MLDCIFCKIVEGEMPAYKIYEDEQFLAFLDIFPYVEGHILVIPKKHYRWVWDVENIGEYFENVTKISKHLQKVTGNDLVYSTIFGEAVPHAHIHLLPGINQSDIDNILRHIERKQKLSESDGEIMVEKLKL